MSDLGIICALFGYLLRSSDDADIVSSNVMQQLATQGLRSVPGAPLQTVEVIKQCFEYLIMETIFLVIPTTRLYSYYRAIKIVCMYLNDYLKSLKKSNELGID